MSNSQVDRLDYTANGIPLEHSKGLVGDRYCRWEENMVKQIYPKMSEIFQQ